ncbi:MAG: hypothetical protein ACTHP8_18225 [Bosea sp. (in: a-proteobacteria)]|uniref:hypothetical protein n=1 Tax=Bosea sp. (in: a-proteobacteria) TaxID=1871050 RepID=UPI003F7C181D
MARATQRTGWRRSATTLFVAYILVLQTTLTALASGLAAQPDPFLTTPLCSPGQSAPLDPARQSGKTSLPACCATFCLALATAVPPAAATVTADFPAWRFIARPPVRSDTANPATTGVYPLGARAPPLPV